MDATLFANSSQHCLMLHNYCVQLHTLLHVVEIVVQSLKPVELLANCNYGRKNCWELLANNVAPVLPGL